MKLKLIRDTVFKQTPIQSIELPDNEKVKVAAGKEFELHSYAEMGDHVRIALLNASLKGRNTWVVFQPHVEIIRDDGTKVIGRYEPGAQLPEKVNFPVPWFSQLNNKLKPRGTCNVTTVAMCLYYYGIRPANPNTQLEDELFKRVESHGWDRHVHDHLRRLFIEYGVFDEFKMDASWNEVKTHLANKNPVVLPGKFTAVGHIIVLRGYDETGFLVNDPNGEFFHSGYKTNLTGENLHYSNNLIKSKSMNSAEKTWAHFPEKK